MHRGEPAHTRERGRLTYPAEAPEPVARAGRSRSPRLKPTPSLKRRGGDTHRRCAPPVRKARAKATSYCDKSAELRTCGGTVADTCDRDSTRQISAGQRFSPTSLTCPAVRPSYRSSQLVCPGTARESPREGDHTHTCLKCKKLEELRQTDRAAQNPERDHRHRSVRKRTHRMREGSAGAAVIEKPTTTPETPNTPAELLP